MGAWIETRIGSRISRHNLVASYMGAWIETLNSAQTHELLKSHPTWVRGLKLIGVYPNITYLRRILHGCVDWNLQLQPYMSKDVVASYMGAWIETKLSKKLTLVSHVASYMGAWIETQHRLLLQSIMLKIRYLRLKLAKVMFLGLVNPQIQTVISLGITSILQAKMV